MKDRNGNRLRKEDACVVYGSKRDMYAGFYNGYIVEILQKSPWPKDKNHVICNYYNTAFNHVGKAPFDAVRLERLGNIND